MLGVKSTVWIQQCWIFREKPQQWSVCVLPVGQISKWKAIKFGLLIYTRTWSTVRPVVMEITLTFNGKYSVLTNRQTASRAHGDHTRLATLERYRGLKSAVINFRLSRSIIPCNCTINKLFCQDVQLTCYLPDFWVHLEAHEFDHLDLLIWWDTLAYEPLTI